MVSSLCRKSRPDWLIYLAFYPIFIISLQFLGTQGTLRTKEDFMTFKSRILLLTSLTHSLAFAGPSTVKVDGSATVYPITEAMAEEFQRTDPNVRVTVGAAGTGAGYKKFCAGELDVIGASRDIKSEEVKACASANVELMELPVALDGLAVVVSKKNSFAKAITFAQLKKLWEPGSKVKTWKELDPSWPDQPIKLYGPNADHGTFEYFTETINGKAKASRADYNAAADMNAVVSGIANDPLALGYFGYAYFHESQNKLTALSINKDGKAIAPTKDAIFAGTYPLARKLYIVANKKSLAKPEVKGFVEFYLKTASDLVPSTGYVALPPALTNDVQQRFKQLKTGPWQQSAH